MSITHKALEEALEIIDKDISKIKKLAEADETLDRGEATKLTDYIKTLLSVHKEEREQAKSDNLPGKSDDELEDLAKKALDFLNLVPEEKKKEPKQDKKKPVKEKKEKDSESNKDNMPQVQCKSTNESIPKKK